MDITKTEYINRAWKLREIFDSKQTETCSHCNRLMPTQGKGYFHCEDGDIVCSPHCYNKISSQVEKSWSIQGW